jgi:tRNA A-37 threonylcarbamoyl transferase component Bud32
MNCAYCGKTLSARLVKNPVGISISGLHQLDYIHADGTTECVIVHSPQPYDGFYASRKFSEARQKIWDDEIAEESAEATPTGEEE